MSKYGDFIAKKCRDMGLSFNGLDVEADLVMGSTAIYIKGSRMPSVISLLKTMIALNLTEEETVELIDAMVEDARERGEIFEQ